MFNDPALRVVDIKIDLCQLYRILSARKLIKTIEVIADDEAATDEKTVADLRNAVDLGFGADLDWALPIAQAVSKELKEAANYIDRDL